MAVRNILKMGDPRLYQRSSEVRTGQWDMLAPLVTDMIDTMVALDGVGLAATQIGEMKRVVVFQVIQNPRYPDAPEIPQTVLVNPEIECLVEELEDGWEGCLSVPGLRGLVPRYKEIRYRGLDLNGKLIEREVSGFHARVVQHECDHLDGILYPMRIQDMRNFGYEEVLLS